MKEEIKSIVANIVGVDKEEIRGSDHFMEDLGADSIDVVQILQGLSDRFSCHVPDEAAASMLTVNDAAIFVENLLTQQK